MSERVATPQAIMGLGFLLAYFVKVCNYRDRDINSIYPYYTSVLSDPKTGNTLSLIHFVDFFLNSVFFQHPALG